MTLLIASITPVIIFLYTIFKKDKNKEPLSLVAKCFLGGFASIIITLIIDIPLIPYSENIPSPFFKSFFDAFIVAAIPEELSKYVILYWLVWKSKYFDEYYDGIVYAIFVSLGFAMIENLFMFLNMEWVRPLSEPSWLSPDTVSLPYLWAILCPKQDLELLFPDVRI